MNNEVVAVVVTYNRKELLQQCVNKLQNQTCPLDILIIDNASTDGTRYLFIDSPNNVIYMNTGVNLGGAGGFSFGTKNAVEMGYKYIWLLDDDTLPTASALEKLFEADRSLKGKYGFLSSMVFWKDETVCNMNLQKKTKWKFVNKTDSIQEIQYASFVSLFIKSDIINDVGLPYKEFFIWSDDWEYTRRISKKYKSYFVPSSIVHHWCNSNIGADIVNTSADRIERFKYLYRNDVVMYRQDGIDGYCYLFVRDLFHILKILAKTDSKFKKIKILLNATIEGFKFKPEIEYPEK